MVSNYSPWLSTCKAVWGVLCPLWDPRTKETVANRWQSSRVLLGWLGAGAYAVLEESGGTALFSLKMRRLKMDLIAAFHYLKGSLVEQMESDSSQICPHWRWSWAITKENGYGLQQEEVWWDIRVRGLKVVEWKPVETVNSWLGKALSKLIWHWVDSSFLEAGAFISKLDLQRHF